MRFLLILLCFPAIALALSDEDISAALRNPANHGIVHLESVEYQISHPIVLHENEQLIGHGATFKVTWPNSYWFTAISIRPSKVTPVEVESILEKSPRVKLKAVCSSRFQRGDVVALSGYFPGENGAGQTLISSIAAIQGNELTLNDPLIFSIERSAEHGITLTPLVDMNCRISDIAFAKPDHPKNGLVYISVEPNCRNVTISDCRFDANAAVPPTYSSGIVASRCVAQVERCTFRGFSLDAVKFLDTCGGRIADCSVKDSNHAITLFLAQSAEVVSNDISGGDTFVRSHSTGIFLSGEPTGVWGTHSVGDKSCFNRIARNQVDHAGLGVPGAGFAGIHLHRKCHFNTIENNRCTHNDMGIYLETDNDHNRILFNVCSDNNQEKSPNHYGNGIELDWDNDFNAIENNWCEGNSGFGEALGYGIEIRNGTDHDNRYNTVANNVINRTGGVGLVVHGTGARVVGNQIGDNGHNSASLRRREIEISGNDILVAGNKIGPSTVKKEAAPFGYAGIVVERGSNIVISDNDLDTGRWSDGAIVVLPGTRHLCIRTNRIASAMPIGSTVTVNRAELLDIVGNTFRANYNGSPEIVCRQAKACQVDESNRLDKSFESANRPDKPLRVLISQ